MRNMKDLEELSTMEWSCREEEEREELKEKQSETRGESMNHENNKGQMLVSLKLSGNASGGYKIDIEGYDR